MASEREIFYRSGPLNLTTVDWQSAFYRRSVAASLVNGVYTLERDRQQGRYWPQALAPPWWDFFHFHLIRVLVDDVDCSVFGAIYEYKFPHSYCNYFVQNPPRYVVAFRGTMLKQDTMSQDLKLDIQVILNTLQQSPRFQRAMQAVQEMVALAGAANIWLAGHSLGSAIALLAGKNMVKMGFLIETYLFNPPFLSAPIRWVSNVITAGIAVVVNDDWQRSQNDDLVVALSGWTPYLFVNPFDPICAGYIEYFEQREMMGSPFSGALGRDSEPSHLLPSAHLTINLSYSRGFKQDHGIHQWWNTNIQYQSRLHQFR